MTRKTLHEKQMHNSWLYDTFCRDKQATSKDESERAFLVYIKTNIKLHDIICEKCS